MKTCYLDANVLVYFKNDLSPNYKKAVDLIKKLAVGNYIICISSLCLDEFLYAVLSYVRRKDRENSHSILRNLLASVLNIPNLKIVNSPENLLQQLTVVKYMERFSLRPRDAYHLLIMKHNKMKHFATFDRDFEKVFAAKVVKRMGNAI